MTPDDILTVDEAAIIAGRAPESIRRAMYRGSLPAKKIGPRFRGNWVTTRQALEEYLALGSARRRRHRGTGRFISPP